MAYRVMACLSGPHRFRAKQMRLFSKGCARVTGYPEVKSSTVHNRRLHSKPRYAAFFCSFFHFAQRLR
jgi:hypothetical protein